MPDLSVNLAGIQSPNPFWLASAPPTNSGYQVMKAFDAGWGGGGLENTWYPCCECFQPLRRNKLPRKQNGWSQ